MKGNDKNSSKTFGIVLTILGIAFLIGGIKLLLLGDNLYFFMVGVGVTTAGIFITLGKLIGAYVYLGTFVIMAVWSIIESGSNIQHLITRLAVPAIIGAYIFFSKVRSNLEE